MKASEQFARAALGIAGYIGRGALDPMRVGLLEEALTRLGGGDSPLRVRVLARLSEAHPYPFSDELDKGLALGREALDVARRLGDPATMTYALFARDEACWVTPTTPSDYTEERAQLGGSPVTRSCPTGLMIRSLALHCGWGYPRLDGEIEAMPDHGGIP
jgi:hypothetical protein